MRNYSQTSIPMYTVIISYTCETRSILEVDQGVALANSLLVRSHHLLEIE